MEQDASDLGHYQADHRRALLRAIATFQDLEELLKVWLGARYELHQVVDKHGARLTRRDIENKALGGLAIACGNVGLPVVPRFLVEVRNYAAHRAAFAAAKYPTPDVLRSEAERLNRARSEVNFWISEHHNILLQEAEALRMTPAELRALNAPPMPFVDR